MAKKRSRKSSKRKISRRSSPTRSASSSRIPALVKIISILYYIVAVVTIIIGIVLFLGGIIGGSVVSSIGIDQLLQYGAETNPIDEAFIPIILGSLAIGGIIITAVGVFLVFLARALWQGRNWARILVIIFSIIGFISALFEPDIITLLITGLIGGYLWFGKGPRQAFK